MSVAGKAWFGVGVIVSVLGLLILAGFVWNAFDATLEWQAWTTPLWLLFHFWVAKGAFARARLERLDRPDRRDPSIL